MRTLDLGRAQPKQTLFLKDKHRHIAYGGARGGGKSWAVRTKSKLLASLMLLLSGVLPNVSGLGSVEIAFLFVFKGFLGEVNASSVLVLYRIASYFFPFVIGVIVFMACRKKIVPEKKEA